MMMSNISASGGLIPKIASRNLCKSIKNIINYSTSTCSLQSGKCGKEGKKSEYPENKKSFIDEKNS